jgi:hypothetical protein
VSVSYLDPVEKGWKRMLKNLFQPFDLKKWFIIGFGVFLAELTDFGNKSSSSGWDDDGDTEFGEILELPSQAWEWLMGHPHWTTLITLGIIAIIAIIILLTWLSSRGKFIFLDNVVHERALFRQPWQNYKQLANSLFYWRLGFSIVFLITVGIILVSTYTKIYEMYHDFASNSEMIWTAVYSGGILLVLLIISGYVSLFLTDFVVPIMYKNNINTWIAFSHFIPLLSQKLPYFLIYGIFILFLYILVFVVIIAFSLATCCIGFVLLVIPYIGSVITLPISYTFRALSLEFLEQFGPDFKIFPDTETAVADPN